MQRKEGAHKAPSEAFKDWYADWDDGVSCEMLTPGSSGYGLMAWNMTLYGCREEAQSGCDMSGGFLTPAPTAWTCAYDANGSLDIPISEDSVADYRGDNYFGLGMLIGEEDREWLEVIPWVRVKGLRYPDQTFEQETQEYNIPGTISRDASGWYGTVDAIVPMWTVTPIEPVFYEQWSKDITGMWTAYSKSLEASSIPLCAHGGDYHQYYCDNDSCEGGPDCPFEEVSELAVRFACDGFEESQWMTDPQVFDEVMDYAITRYKQGWHRAIEMENGDTCLSRFLRHYSPYSESSASLDFLREPASQRLTA